MSLCVCLPVSLSLCVCVPVCVCLLLISDSSIQTTESHLAEAQDKLLMQEQRLTDQNRMMAELRARLDQSNAGIDSYKERMHNASVDKKSMEAKLASAEQRQREIEEQSREMMAISGKKEEVVQRLQHRIEEQVQEIATLSAQVESIRVDARRQVEQAKDRAAGKVSLTQKQFCTWRVYRLYFVMNVY